MPQEATQWGAARTFDSIDCFHSITHAADKPNIDRAALSNRKAIPSGEDREAKAENLTEEFSEHSKPEDEVSDRRA